MSHRGAAILAATALSLSLAGCFPPLLGDPSPTAESTITGTHDEDAVAEIIIDESGGVLSGYATSDVRDEMDADVPQFEPASCRNSVTPALLFDQDVTAGGWLYRPPALERHFDGAVVTATQFVRLFETDEDAVAFVEQQRAERTACPEFTVVGEGTRVTQLLVEGDLAVEATGYAFEVFQPDGTTLASFEWVLRDGNLLIALGGGGASPEAIAPLRDIAAEYADRIVALR
jgi:hypothetical protein